jgi:hypothetical protein
MIQRALIDHFRCPAEFADFRSLGKSSAKAGFFEFGTGTIAYGALSEGRVTGVASGPLEDVLSRVRIEENTCFLPFDPDEVIDNLRLERYCASPKADSKKSLRKSLVRNAYYAIRPLLPVSVRKHLQRSALRGWDRIPFPHWPVDQTVDRLFEKMLLLSIRTNRFDRVPFIWFWPDDHSSCAIMTHDVETSAGRDFCSSLMDLNDVYGIKSSFQIVPEERYGVPAEYLQLIRDRGFEVNVHDLNHDGNLFRDREQFLNRVKRINEYGKKFEAVGYRSGVLYRNLDWYDEFDFSYDMSVPNVGHLDPQPGGCCTTKPYFIGKLLEIPVTATQDYTLFHILQQYSTDLWKQQIELILNQHGIASFIVHPDYVIEKQAREIYEALLAHLADLRNASHLWLPLPREVNSWWRMRSEMRLVQENEDWRIEGPGKERARVAFAREEDGNIVYEIESRKESGVRA